MDFGPSQSNVGLTVTADFFFFWEIGKKEPKDLSLANVAIYICTYIYIYLSNYQSIYRPYLYLPRYLSKSLYIYLFLQKCIYSYTYVYKIYNSFIFVLCYSYLLSKPTIFPSFISYTVTYTDFVLISFSEQKWQFYVLMFSTFTFINVNTNCFHGGCSRGGKRVIEGGAANIYEYRSMVQVWRTKDVNNGVREMVSFI